MKIRKAAYWVLRISGILIGTLALVFLFVEARLLFSGDLLVYSNPALAIFKTIFHIIVCFLGIGAAVLPFIQIKKENPVLEIYLHLLALALSISMIAIAGNMESRPAILGQAFITIANIYWSGSILLFISTCLLKRKKEEKAEE